MRPLVLLLCCCAAFAAAHAQKQEESMMNRLLDGPDHPYKNSMASKTFQGSASLNLHAAPGQNSFAAGNKSFASKDFSTRSFLGIKNPWFGRKVYDTDAASLWTKSEMPGKENTFETKSEAVHAYDKSGQAPSIAIKPVDTHPYLVKGAAQGAVDQMKKNLTVEDVRELLNKDHKNQ